MENKDLLEYNAILDEQNKLTDKLNSIKERSETLKQKYNENSNENFNKEIKMLEIECYKLIGELKQVNLKAKNLKNRLETE